MKFNFKAALPDAICVILFAVIAFAYFLQPTIDGKRLTQHDNAAADGLSVEINQYREANGGETPRWTNSVFGGMPTFQISPSYDSTRTLSFIEKVYHLWMPDYVFYIFISMLGFYILLRAFDFRQWMAALGAIVWAFSSYFFIIIAAGHIWKVLTLAYIPPTIAGMVLCYKGKYLWGGITTAFFAALQILSNHVQMTYYFLIPEIFMVIGYLVAAIRNKTVPNFLKATGTLVVAAVIAVALNASNLYHTYEYQKDTMRGKSELVKQGKTEDQTDTGLERSYITAWSYGIGETWSLLIPNINGGASVPLQDNSTAMDKADPRFKDAGIYGAFTQYWGDQPGTSGPVYVGAFVFMLFILSFIIVPDKNPVKWALFFATILSIALAWGHNFMPFTDFFIDHVPLYAKFRTVSSILVVAEFTIPLLALLALKEFVQHPTAKNVKWLLIATGITLVVCLVFIIMPEAIFGQAVSNSDRSAISQYVQQQYFDQQTGQGILASISTMRYAMLNADAWRSIVIILIGAGIMYWYAAKTAIDIKTGELIFNAKLATTLSIALLVLCLVDMWTVNKRYLNDGMFQYASGPQAQPKTEADNCILEKSGNGRNYRVLNMTVSTFNDNTTSYFYSSVGGYHAAKLRRYQELIEEHVMPNMQKIYEALSEATPDTIAMYQQQSKFPIYDLSSIDTDKYYPVLNMLNARWFILQGQEGAKIPIENTAAYGNAWFVDNVKFVSNANEEIAALHSVSPRHTAIVDKTLAANAFINDSALPADSTATVQQTALTANSVSYEVDSKKGGMIVFSEVYYPGWTATIDGVEAPVGRADYVLRAMMVPAGHHIIQMTFDPQSVHTTETVAYVALALLIIAVALGIWINMKKQKVEA